MRAKLRRRLLIWGGGLIVMCGLLILAVWLLVPADRVRKLVMAQIEQATGAQVELGAASLTIWPRLGVRLDHGRIQGSGDQLRRATGAQSDVQDYSIELERLEVQVALWPLLRHRLETGQIRLVTPRIAVTTGRTSSPPGSPPAPGDSAGTATGPAPTASGGGLQEQPPPTGPGGSGQSAMPWQLAVAGLEVRDGSLRWREVGTDRSITLSGWQQDVDSVDLALLLQRLGALGTGQAPIGAKQETSVLAVTCRLGQLSLAGFGPPSPLLLQEVALSASLAIDAEASELAIDIRTLRWQHLDLQGQATLAPLAPGGGGLRGNWHLAPIQLADLLEDLQGSSLLPAAGARDWLASRPVRAGQLQLSGTLEVPWPLPSQAPGNLWLAAIGCEGKMEDLTLSLPGKDSEVTCDASFNVSNGFLRILGLNLNVDETALALSGGLTLPLPGAVGRLTADLKAQADLATATEVARRLSAASHRTATPGLNADLEGQISCSLKVDLADSQVYAGGRVWKQRWQKGQLDGVQIGLQVERLRVGGPVPAGPWSVQVLGASSDLRKAEFTCGGIENAALTGQLSGRVRKLTPEPQLELDVALRRLDVDLLTDLLTRPVKTAQLARQVPEPRAWWMAWPAAARAAEAAVPPAPHPPGQWLPASLHARVQGQADEVIVKKVRYKQARIEGQLERKVFAFSHLQAALGSGQVQGQGSLDFNDDPYGLLSFTAQVDRVPATTLLEPYLPGIAPLWQGVISSTVAGTCALQQDKRAALASLGLDGSATSSDGTIDARPLLSKVSAYLGKRQDLQLIRFKEFFHHLKVEDGRYLIEGLRLEGPDTDWLGDGWIAFDGTLDLWLSVKLPADFQPDLGDMTFLAENLRGQDGRIQLRMHLTGPGASPAVELDLSAAKARAQENLQENLQKGVKGLLDKLKGR